MSTLKPMQHVSRHRSPGMTAIYNAVKKNTRNHVLDLGPCTAANFEFFSQLGCHFHFENFTQSINERLTNHRDAPADWLERFLKYLKPNDQFDIILVWDLFNFVSVAEQIKIYEKLERFLKVDSLLYVVNYVGSQRPKAPENFKIHDKYNIDITKNNQHCENTTKTTTVQLLKSLPNFNVLRSYINIEGMQGGISEHILSHKPERNTVKSVFSTAEVINNASKVDAEFRSPAFNHIFEQTADRQNLNILDLGGRSLSNEERWKSQFGDVFTVDFRRVLQRLDTVNKQAKVDYLKNGSYFYFEKEQRFDVIVFWDFFNYLDDDSLQAVGERLAELAKDGTLLVCINYNTPQIPASPRQYALTETGIGIKEPAIPALINRERTPLNSLKVQKYLPGFFIKHTYTIQPGMQRGTSEYILVFKDQFTQAKEKEALYAQVMERRRQRELQAQNEQAAKQAEQNALMTEDVAEA